MWTVIFRSIFHRSLYLLYNVRIYIYVYIGRHLLHQEESGNHVTGSDVTATSQGEGNRATEAIASALAAAVLDKEEAVSSSEDEEDQEMPTPSGPQEQNVLNLVQLEDCSSTNHASLEGEVKGAVLVQSPPQQSEVSSAEQHLEDKHLKLKSGKMRSMHREERAPCVAVQDACLGREAFTIEVLLGLLQDPDHGAHRAQVNKDVLIRKGELGLMRPTMQHCTDCAACVAACVLRQTRL